MATFDKAQNKRLLSTHVMKLWSLVIVFVHLRGAPVYGADVDMSATLRTEETNTVDTDRQRAVAHFNKGMELLREKNFKSAAAEFEHANHFHSTRDGVFYLATCYMEMQRYIDASKQIALLKELDGDQLNSEWQTNILELEKKIKKGSLSVSIEVNIDGALVSVDGKHIGVTPIPTPILMDIGEHEVLVTKKGYEPQRLKLSGKSGNVSSLSITLYRVTQQDENLAPLNSEQEDGMKTGPTRRRRVWTWVAYGIGGATGIAAIVTGTKAVSLRRDVEENCINNSCPADQKDDIETSDSLRIATNVLIGVTAASVIAGTILFFVEGRQKSDSLAVTPSIIRDGAGIMWFKTF